MGPEQSSMDAENVEVVSVEPNDPNVVDVVDVVATEVKEPVLDGDGNPVPDAEPAKKPIQPRINELTRLRHEAEREAQYWKGVAQGKSQAAPALAPAVETPAKPDIKDYDDYNKYVDDLTDWKSDRAVEKALAKVNVKIEERSSQQTAQEQEAERGKNWQTRLSATKAVITDFDDVIAAQADSRLPDHVGDLILDSDHGPAILYKMAKDPALTEKLASMSPIQAAKEFGKMEDAFERAASSITPTPPKIAATVSKAPPAPTRIGAAPATVKPLQELSMDDYVAARKAQGARWGRS
jgi:hypothetical protein